MENYENIKNLVVRDIDGKIISTNGFCVGDEVLSEINGEHIINQYFELNGRAYVRYDNNKKAPIDDFFYRTNK